MAKKNYLFVCISNVKRSKLGKQVFEEMLKERGFSLGSLEDSLSEVSVDSAGVSARIGDNVETKQYSKGMENSYEIIFAMDTLVANSLIDYFKVSPNRIIDLEKQGYKELGYISPSQVLRSKLEKYLPEKNGKK